jgi:prepilin-type N-terminal cleavage/methylation domain-containing protein
MTRLLRGFSRRIGDEHGFTLPEVLMALVVGLMVVGVSVTVFVGAIRTQPGLNQRDDAISQARTTMERLTRELRQGSTVVTATASQLAFVTYVHSASCGGAYSATSMACRVTYSCSGTSCTRVEAKPDGTSPGSAYAVVSGLSSPNIFNYSPSVSAPTYIGAILVFPGQNGSDAITLSDGVTLRS